MIKFSNIEYYIHKDYKKLLYILNTYSTIDIDWEYFHATSYRAHQGIDCFIREDSSKKYDVNVIKSIIVIFNIDFMHNQVIWGTNSSTQNKKKATIKETIKLFDERYKALLNFI